MISSEGKLCYTIVVTTPQLWQSSHTAEHASLAELILRLRDQSGLGFPHIADELNSLGLLSPRGKPFYSALMHSMYHKWTLRRFRQARGVVLNPALRAVARSLRRFVHCPRHASVDGATCR